MRDALRDLPGPVLALLIAAVIMGTMAIATWAFKLARPERERTEDNFMDAGLALAGLSFSLLAAFVTFFRALEMLATLPGGSASPAP